MNKPDHPRLARQRDQYIATLDGTTYGTAKHNAATGLWDWTAAGRSGTAAEGQALSALARIGHELRIGITD